MCVAGENNMPWGPHAGPPRDGDWGFLKICPVPPINKKITPYYSRLISSVHSNGCAVDLIVQFSRSYLNLKCTCTIGAGDFVVDSDGSDSGAH